MFHFSVGCNLFNLLFLSLTDVNYFETCSVSKNLSETLFSNKRNFGPIGDNNLYIFLKNWFEKFLSIFDINQRENCEKCFVSKKIVENFFSKIENFVP